MTTELDERLIEYVAGELSDDPADAFTEQLFGGELDGDDLTELSALLVGLREAAYLGVLNVIVPPEHAERMRAAGYRVKSFRLEPGVELVSDVSGDFDLLFVEFVVDLTGVETIVSEVCDARGVPFKKSGSIAIPPGVRSVTGYCARELALASARELPDGVVTRIYAVEPDGERLLGEFKNRMTVSPSPSGS